MTAASVSGITIIDDADQSTDGTLISGGTSPTAPSNYAYKGILTAGSAGWSVARRHNITTSTQYVGKRFSFSATNFTNQLVMFATTAGGSARNYLSTFGFEEAPPAFDATADTNVHLGFIFQVKQAGSCVGGRFYKLPINTGTHYLNLYNDSGTLLQSVQITDESEFGWQDFLFTTPQSLTANTNYRIAYKAPIGGYSASSNFFTTAYDTGRSIAGTGAVVSGQGTSTGGVYAYSASNSAFPNSAFNSSNYWIDPLFIPNSVTWNLYPSLDRLQTKTNRGLVVRLYSGGSTTTNYIEAIIGGESATTAPTFDTPTELNTGVRDWTVHVLDPAAGLFTTNGTFDITNVTSIEFRTSFIGQAPSYFSVNKICRLQRLTVTGGTSPDAAATFANFNSYQSSSSIKTWFSAKTGTQYFFILPLRIGDGTTATRLIESGFSLIWHGKESNTANPWRYIYNDSALGLTIEANATATLTRGQFSGGGSKLHFYCYSSTATLTDCIMPVIGLNTFNAGTLTGCTFTGSDHLVLNGATFSACTIQDSTDATGALYWQSTSSTINGCTFLNNTAAIAVVLSGNRTINLSALTFSDNTNDWIVTGTGTLTIVVDSATTTNKTWANTTGGTTANGVNASGLTGNVVFQMPQPTLTFTGLPSGTEARVTQGSKTLDYTSNITSGTYAYTYTYVSGEKVQVSFNNPGYVQYRETFTLSSTSQTIPLTFDPDPSYVS